MLSVARATLRQGGGAAAAASPPSAHSARWSQRVKMRSNCALGWRTIHPKRPSAATPATTGMPPPGMRAGCDGVLGVRGAAGGGEDEPENGQATEVEQRGERIRAVAGCHREQALLEQRPERRGDPLQQVRLHRGGSGRGRGMEPTASCSGCSQCSTLVGTITQSWWPPKFGR